MRSIAATIFFVALLFAPDAVAQQFVTGGDRRAQTGMKFLSVSVDARAAAMGNAMTAREGYATATLYNPAGIARLQGLTSVALGQTQWIAETDYNMGTVAFRPANGRYGSFGATVMAVDYSKFIKTVRADNDQGYRDIGSYSPTALSAGVTYARALTDRFSVGGTVKYVRQNLGSHVTQQTENGFASEDYALSTAAFDLGVIYQTGFRSLNFAFSTRNFSPWEISYVDESFELPLTFQLGLAMDMIDLTQLDTDTHSMLLSVDAMHPRDYSEQIHVGGEYIFMNTLALRAGYIFPEDEQGISLGVGLQQSLSGFAASFNYAYTQFGRFGNVNRLSLQLSY